MRTKAKVYVGVVIAVGLACFTYSVITYFSAFSTLADRSFEITSLILMLVLSILCHSLPVFLDKNIQLDISTIITLSAMLLKGPYFAAIIAFAGYFFRFVRDSGKWFCIFTTPIYKTLFNSSTLSITAFLSGLFSMYVTGMNWVGGVPSFFRAGDVVLPALLFVLAHFLLNMLIMGFLIAFISGNRVFNTMLVSTWGVVITNILATMPLGYFIMRLMLIREDTIVLIVLFCIPLFLTRFTFKLNMEARERYYQTISMLMNAIEARDVYTEGHSRRVEYYAALLADHLGFNGTRINNIKVAATLHDVGKIGIVDAILRKPGPLSPEERLTIQGHPTIALHILDGVQFSPIVIDAIRHHHERFDGSGYPDGLRGSQISIEACILGVVDVYDAMTTDRPYRKAIPKDKVLAMMAEESGKHFNPKVIDAFIKLITSMPDEGEIK